MNTVTDTDVSETGIQEIITSLLWFILSDLEISSVKRSQAQFVRFFSTLYGKTCHYCAFKIEEFSWEKFTRKSSYGRRQVYHANFFEKIVQAQLEVVEISFLTRIFTKTNAQGGLKTPINPTTRQLDKP